MLFRYGRLHAPEHLHASYELTVPLKGEIHIMLDGIQRTVSPGELVLVAPGTPHGYPKIDDCFGFMAIFSPEMLSGVDGESLSGRPSAPIVSVSSADPDVAHCLMRLQEMADPGKYVEPLARAYLSLIFLRLLPMLKPETGAATGDLLYRAMQFIAQNLARPLDLRAAAHALGVNTSYLSHVLNEKLHMGFRAYLNALRIDRARRMLRATNLPVEEISVACGFANLRTFDRVFIERCRITPRDYRKRCSQELQGVSE